MNSPVVLKNNKRKIDYDSFWEQRVKKQIKRNEGKKRETKRLNINLAIAINFISARKEKVGIHQRKSRPLFRKPVTYPQNSKDSNVINII